jgi:hypothetical protein
MSTTTKQTSQPSAATRQAKAQPEQPGAGISPGGLLIYLLIGIVFGVILVKSEVVSWFRIQEMFRFESFHMYGIIGSAIAVAAASIQLIKRLDITTFGGEPISIPPKVWGKGYRYWIGGMIFGLGWALLGACPGPMFALIGAGYPIILAALFSALLGTWAYSYLRPSLPH